MKLYHVIVYEDHDGYSTEDSRLITDLSGLLGLIDGPRVIREFKPKDRTSFERMKRASGKFNETVPQWILRVKQMRRPKLWTRKEIYKMGLYDNVKHHIGYLDVEIRRIK